MEAILSCVVNRICPRLDRREDPFTLDLRCYCCRPSVTSNSGTFPLRPFAILFIFHIIFSVFRWSNKHPLIFACKLLGNSVGTARVRLPLLSANFPEDKRPNAAPLLSRTNLRELLRTRGGLSEGNDPPNIKIIAFDNVFVDALPRTAISGIFRQFDFQNRADEIFSGWRL